MPEEAPEKKTYVIREVWENVFTVEAENLEAAEKLGEDTPLDACNLGFVSATVEAVVPIEEDDGDYGEPPERCHCED